MAFIEEDTFFTWINLDFLSKIPLMALQNIGKAYMKHYLTFSSQDYLKYIFENLILTL